tara:strand:+ start:156 stop:377 length:222 start_codon:yes stop_codon:yes gene_type:complete
MSNQTEPARTMLSHLVDLVSEYEIEPDQAIDLVDQLTYIIYRLIYGVRDANVYGASSLTDAVTDCIDALEFGQ